MTPVPLSSPSSLSSTHIVIVTTTTTTTLSLSYPLSLLTSAMYSEPVMKCVAPQMTSLLC